MTTFQAVRFSKPFVFAACLAPLALLVARAAGILQPGLGANPVEAILDELGIWGLRLLLVTLAVTPLRQVTGYNWLVRYRRMLGLFAFTYCLAHFLTYFVLDQTLFLPAILEDVIERPFITLGFLALLLLVPMAVTSTAGWRRRLGRRWTTLHRASYAVAILVCWHFYWQVKKDLTEPLIYCAILALLLGWRMVRARRRAPRRRSDLDADPARP